MAERLRWGVMGNANIARVCMIPAIQKSANGIIHALATRSPEQAAELAARHHIRHVFDSYEALLNDPAIDAIYIPLPNHLHHPWTLRSLEAGKHVLCEKPLACNTAEAEDMAAAANDAGLLLMEALMYRFHPRNRRIRRLVAGGSLGSLRLVRSAFCYHMDEALLNSGENARLKSEMGGGALLDVGCYSVSVARWFFGTEPTELQAQAVYHAGGVDVHFVGSLRFPEDGLATLEASFISALQQTYTVVGTDRAIDLPHNAFVPWEKDTVFFLREKDQEEGQAHKVAGADEYRLMVEHFADAVSGKTALAFSPEDSIDNMRVLDGLAKAAKTHQTIKL